MGLERISTVMQGVTSNYDTDLFQGIIRHIEKLSGKEYGENDKDDVSMRVIADHARAATFLICDGALPSNEGRGYVLRRIMRRAARHAKMLGFAEPMLYRAVDAVNEMMADAYPELLERETYIKKVILAEEETVHRNPRQRPPDSERGDRLPSAGRARPSFPARPFFRLYDTFGFPTDLTGDIVAGEGFTIDEAGFESCMERQREQAREHWKGSGEEGIAAIHKTLHTRGVRSRFVGYGEQTAYSPVTAIVRDGNEVSAAEAGDVVEIICESTPFYGESGGQAGDTGAISTGSAHLQVTSALRPFPDLIIHRAVVISGTIAVGEAADLKIAVGERNATARNHTATHLLQTALKEVLGDHVKQAGSLVSPDRLRFDFTHFSAMTPEEIRRVEDLVNGYIMQNDDVHAREMAVQEALESGATALFGEKYGDRVRVVRVGSISSELCGGTHVHAAGDIGFFKILTETGIAAGVRRIEALTGTGAIRHVRQLEDEQKKITSLIKAEGSDPVEKLEKLMARQKELLREIETLMARLNASKSADLLEGLREVAGVKVLTAKIETNDPKGLRELSDTLKDRIGSGIIALGCENGGKANLLVAVTGDLTSRFKAGDIVKALAPVIGGSGGGKPELAQAGGGLPDKLSEALEMVYKIIS